MNCIPLPRLISGGLMLSYRCSAACRHCMYACSPRWDGDWISEDDLARGLAALAPYIQPSPWGRDTISLNHGLHFTGGEPFLNCPLLHRAVQIAHEMGIPSTFVETNSFWCRDDELTRDRLMALRDAGLQGIMISVNPFYAEYVPFERTRRCIRISRQVFGQNVFVYQREYDALFRELGIRGKLALCDYMERAQERELWVEMFLMGRAARKLRSYYPRYPARRFYAQPCQPPFLRPWHNHFDNYGNLIPGYCGGISLGNWYEIDALIANGIDLDERPTLTYLIREDVRGLLRYATGLGYAEREDGYLSKCDLCLDIRSYLVTVGDYPELTPRAFYERLDDGPTESPTERNV